MLVDVLSCGTSNMEKNSSCLLWQHLDKVSGLALNQEPSSQMNRWLLSYNPLSKLSLGLISVLILVFFNKIFKFYFLEMSILGDEKYGWGKLVCGEPFIFFSFFFNKICKMKISWNIVFMLMATFRLPAGGIKP